MRPIVLFIVCFTVTLSSTGCATKRPVLYPNDKMQTVGKAQAQSDTDGCIRAAKSGVGTAEPGEKVVGASAGGAAVGEATGAAGGALSGNAGIGAATGAVGGAAGGFVWSIFQARDPDPVYAGFVERCLREKGYEPIGWR